MTECEFKDLCFDAHMMLAEKTMLYKDSFCMMEGIEDGHESCLMYLLVQNVLNSPQFKKQYANREELVEAIRERQILGEITFPEIENIIRTHALKEE